MNIVFRVDSSYSIGTGHVMRCLTLAKELKKNSNIQFICRNRSGNLINKIESEGYKVLQLNSKEPRHKISLSKKIDWLGTSQEQEILDSKKVLKEIKPDWLIVDHYGIGSHWHEEMYKFSKKLLVIDDLANRHYNCDLLLDQNYYEDTFSRYKNLVQSKCKLLLGPKYALLRKEFSIKSPSWRNIDINRILVYFGGLDIKDNILKTLKGIEGCKRNNINVDVIVGQNSLFNEEIINLSSNIKNIKIYDFVDNIGEMMRNSDLYIGSAGTTTWERSCAGLPSIVISVAENQVEPMKELKKAGISFFLGSHEKVNSQDILKQLNKIIDNPSVLEKMRQKNLDLVDGYGVSRCVSEILVNS